MCRREERKSWETAVNPILEMVIPSTHNTTSYYYLLTEQTELISFLVVLNIKQKET